MLSSNLSSQHLSQAALSRSRFLRLAAGALQLLEHQVFILENGLCQKQFERVGRI